MRTDETGRHPAASDLDPPARIGLDTAALADAAEGHLDVVVPSCPGWTVADLVNHLYGVHQFWGDVVERRLTDIQPLSPPARPADDQLLDALRSGAARLVQVLDAADPAVPVWTWASQKDTAFVIRHQVQEAAVHRWDVEHALGRAWAIDPAAATDSVESFLSFGIQSIDALGGATVRLVATDVRVAWTIAADRWWRGDSDDPGAVLRAPASDVLLWLYERLPTSALRVDGDLALLEAVQVAGRGDE